MMDLPRPWIYLRKLSDFLPLISYLDGFDRTYWAATDWDHQDEKADANGALQASGSDQKS